MTRAQTVVLALLTVHALLGMLCLAMARGEYRSPVLRWWGYGCVMYAAGLLVNLLGAGFPTPVLPHPVALWLGNSLVTIAPLLCTAGMLKHTSRALNAWVVGLPLAAVLAALVLANFAGVQTGLVNLIGSTLYAIPLFTFSAWALWSDAPRAATAPTRVVVFTLAFAITAWTLRTTSLLFFTAGGADKGAVDAFVSFFGLAQILAGVSATFALLWIEARLAQVQLTQVNRSLAERVREQVDHIERLGQLKHFFPAPVAEKIVSERAFDPSLMHRREITVMAVDLRGFTAFSESAEPEEVMGVLNAYHAELGVLVNQNRATLEHFAGDGALLFLNDPVEVSDHTLRACEMAVALERALRPRLREWQQAHPALGLGIGLATGYATIGAIGFEGRWEYSAIGAVCNLAARLCDEARDGQILIPQRVHRAVAAEVVAEPLGELHLKGMFSPVPVSNVRAVRGARAIAGDISPKQTEHAQS
jgi:class 3 adenylate cyclase